MLPDGNLIVASFATNGVKLFNPCTGAFVRDFIPAGRGGLNGTHFFEFVPEGNVSGPGECGN